MKHAEAKGGLRNAMDCVGEGGTEQKSAAALGEQGGTISMIMPLSKEGNGRSDVKSVWSLAYELMGKVSDITLHTTPSQCTTDTDHSRV